MLLITQDGRLPRRFRAKRLSTASTERQPTELPIRHRFGHAGRATAEAWASGAVISVTPSRGASKAPARLMMHCVKVATPREGEGFQRHLLRRRSSTHDDTPLFSTLSHGRRAVVAILGRPRRFPADDYRSPMSRERQRSAPGRRAESAQPSWS